MSDVLVVAETRQGAVRDVTLELVTAGRSLADQTGGQLRVALVTRDAEWLAERLQLAGVDEIVLVEPAAESFEPHVVEAALAQLAGAINPTAILFSHTVDSMAVAPALAAVNHYGFASDVAELAWSENEVVVRRGAYGGRLISEQRLGQGRPVVVMVRPGVFSSPTESGQPGRRVITPDLPQIAVTEHLGFVEPTGDDVDLGSAEVILAIGRGVPDRDAVSRFEALATKLGGTLAGSRPLVDAGWLPSSRQVGQSGQTVKPRVYLAFGISGAIQHLAGMRGAQTIFAVNTDAEAPIFNVAHYGAVADLEEVAESLEELLS